MYRSRWSTPGNSGGIHLLENGPMPVASGEAPRHTLRTQSHGDVDPAVRRIEASRTRSTRMSGATRSRPIRVLCVDDHRIVREGIALILGRQPDMKVVGLAASGE